MKKIISNQKEIEKAKKIWCKKLNLNPNKIYCKFETDKSNDFYRLAEHYGGAFCDYNPNGKGYLVVLTSIDKGKSNTDVALVHELLHIKEGHVEEEKRWYWYIIGFLIEPQFELTINKYLLPKYF